jgi:hypothetical protein
MNKEFVTYEQALALKELGFDEPCIMTYLNGELDKELFLFNHSIRSHPTQEFISAPLKQQAFRWFREKHGLQHEIINDLGNDLSSIVYVYSIFAVDRSEEYKTYEEAEQACLDKLIEICKNK